MPYYTINKQHQHNNIASSHAAANTTMHHTPSAADPVFGCSDDVSMAFAALYVLCTELRDTLDMVDTRDERDSHDDREPPARLRHGDSGTESNGMSTLWKT